MIYSPLEQFNLISYIKLGILHYDLSITNSTYFLFLIFIFIFILLKSPYKKLIGNNWNWLTKNIYKFILNLIDEQIGKEGYKYFNFIFTIFIFILFSNLIGLIPYSFTVTSHVAITFGLSLSLFIGITTLGIIKNGFSFINLFLPSGVPTFLIPLIMFIEFVSYLTRPISLGMRLIANLFAGHTLLAIIGYFIDKFISMGILGSLISIIPFILLMLLIVLELVIAFLQTYVFTLLITSYINDVLHINH